MVTTSGHEKINNHRFGRLWMASLFFGTEQTDTLDNKRQFYFRGTYGYEISKKKKKIYDQIDTVVTEKVR